MTYDDLSNSGFRKAARAAELRQQRIRDAAPDLLAALKEMLVHIDDDMNSRPICLWKRRETVCAAIAKAEGTS